MYIHISCTYINITDKKDICTIKKQSWSAYCIRKEKVRGLGIYLLYIFDAMLDARKLKEYEKQKKKHEVGQYHNYLIYVH